MYKNRGEYCEMNWEQLDELGRQLREIGHRRRKLAEQIYSEVQEGSAEESLELYRELSELSDSAIELMQHQKRLFEEEIQ